MDDRCDNMDGAKKGIEKKNDDDDKERMIVHVD